MASDSRLEVVIGVEGRGAPTTRIRQHQSSGSSNDMSLPIVSGSSDLPIEFVSDDA